MYKFQISKSFPSLILNLSEKHENLQNKLSAPFSSIHFQLFYYIGHIVFFSNFKFFKSSTWYAF